MEIGIDIEQNERFVNLSKTMISRVYTNREYENAMKNKDYAHHLCALWCVKEATVKAFSNLKIPFAEIEVTYSPEGKPSIVLNETIKNELSKINCSQIKISMSHANDYSTAICLIY